MDKFLRHARFYFTDEVIQELRDARVSRVKAAAQEHGFCIPAGKKKISGMNLPTRMNIHFS